MDEAKNETSTMNDTSTGWFYRALRAVFESQKGSEDNTGIHEEPERPIEQNDEDLIFHDAENGEETEEFFDCDDSIPDDDRSIRHKDLCPQYFFLMRLKAEQKPKDKRIAADKGLPLYLPRSGISLDDLRQRSGVISFKQKVKTLEHWQRKSGDFDYWSLIEMTEAFTGEGIDQDVLGDKTDNLKVLQAIARMIPNDKWMRFVRLELGLNRKEIKELHRQYATFTEDQLIDIMEHLSIYGRLPEEAPTSATKDGCQKPLPNMGMNAHGGQLDIRMPVGDLDPDNARALIFSISRRIPQENRKRFLRTVLGASREELEQICDLDEDDVFDALENYLVDKATAQEQERILRTYAPKMQTKTQNDLETCDFLPDERLLNQCIYDIIDAMPGRRIDFLSRMGIESTWKPFRERSITTHDLSNVMNFWWTNIASRTPEELAALALAAQAFVADR